MAPNRRCKEKTKFLPRRPLRPVTAFNLFFRDYFCNARLPANPGERWVLKASQEIMKRAGICWKNLSAVRRCAFIGTARGTIPKYREAVEEWEEIRDLLRKPVNAYLLYLKYYCRTNRNLAFRRIGSTVGRCWNALDPRVKRHYKEQSKRNRQRYTNMMAELERGKSVYDFISDGRSC